MTVYILYAIGGGMVQISGVVTKRQHAVKWATGGASRTFKGVELDDPEITQRKKRKAKSHV